MALSSKCCVMMVVFHICTIQHGDYWSHVLLST